MEDKKSLKVGKETWFSLMEKKLKEGFSSVEELIQFMFKKTFKTGDEKNGKNKSSR